MNKNRTLSEFGQKVKIALVYKNKNQNWLIAEMKRQTLKYVDSSNLHKIMTAQIKSPDLEALISKILDIDSNKADSNSGTGKVP